MPGQYRATVLGVVTLVPVSGAGQKFVAVIGVRKYSDTTASLEHLLIESTD